MVEDLKQALVLHPRFSLYGGGELLCLNVIKALNDKNYHVTLATDSYSPATAEKIYGPIGRTLLDVEPLFVPAFKRFFRRALAYQHIRYAGKIQHLFEKNHPEIVFSTQSSLYYVPGVDTFHFIYDIVDLSVVKFKHHIASSWWKWPYYRALKKYRAMLEKPEPSRHFLALGKAISHDLSEMGYESKLIIPPCPIDYSPLPKKKQVVFVTRVVPQKRLEDFATIARGLPNYPFHILGLTNEPFKKYKQEVLAKMPENVFYHEKGLREAHQIMQESMVYLYTSHEPGLPIALVQGIGAGCYPVVPSEGGGREAIELAGIGEYYYDTSLAKWLIKRTMMNPPIPQRIAESVRDFSSERFRDCIGQLVA